MFHSGSTGRLSIGETNPVEIGRMRNWSYAISQAVLDTTTLEDLDATVVPGTRSLSGSGSCITTATGHLEPLATLQG